MQRRVMRMLMNLAARKATQIHLDKNRDESGYRDWCAVVREVGVEPGELSKLASDFEKQLAKRPPYGHQIETFALFEDV